MRGTKTNCLTCGKEYKVCPHCGDASWRQTACSPLCWQISQIINQSFFGLIDAAEAKAELERLHYKDAALTEETQAQIAKILEDAKTAAKHRRKAAEQEDPTQENA